MTCHRAKSERERQRYRCAFVVTSSPCQRSGKIVIRKSYAPIDLEQGQICGRIRAQEFTCLTNRDTMNKTPVCSKCRDENKTAYERGTWRLYICNDCHGQYEKAWFGIAGMPAMEMLHDPTDLWNGWNNPKFTLEQAQTFIAWTNAPEQEKTWKQDMPETFFFNNDVNGNARLFTCWKYHDDTQSDIEEMKPEEIDGVNYYGIGSWSWCWTACETENEANEVW
jgi:hypothetical protein